MRIASRTKTTAFFIVLGALLVALALTLNITWIVYNWREFGLVIFGIIVFGLIIAGVTLNTIFLVREIRRNEQQDSFLNAVTHELKTPIASIRLYLETLQSRNLDEPQRGEFYRIMIDDTDRLLGMVEQVLRATKVRSSQTVRQQLEFGEVVRDTVELARLRHHLNENQLRLAMSSDDPITVVGAPDELRTAVANLVDNAVKYSHTKRDETEKPEIVVEVVTPNIDTVMVQVRDKGIGIPQSELKRIFKRFYRVQSRATGHVKGTGLGLFIVRSIARKHGGDAFAESEGEGCGSTLTIRLPRVYRV
jgi:two-component system, OmpR family, sensor histidine kinase SenX3